jgi:adenylate cyclase
VVGLAVLGEAERARDWARRAMAIDPENVIMRYNLACAMSAHLRDADTALELLADAIPAAAKRLVEYSKSDPQLAPIRDDPRFQDMIAAAEARLAAAERAGSPATAP